ncbi:hypothetical protein FACS1894161_5130 [Spirochaetia bacterium]|nr:hypothetical protein FACS1894161_5130 [Spirochaetia bacterium]
MNGTECRMEGDSDYWRKNLAVLREKYPALAEQALNERDKAGGQSDPVNDTIRIEQAASGDPALTINGTHIHSNRDPVREGRRQAEAVLSQAGANGAFVALGFGLGYGAEALAKAAGSRPLIIVERRPVLFRLALECRNMETFLSSGRLIFVMGGEATGISGALY